ncbi:MAG: hypothetical protein HKP61_14500 [Dactylosporangium sp.]|nr:hypothetical protein [Dactylosporangium sp.]NNJ62122.1 hypothetical protein [Dactylosporangium sp.]
MPVTAVDGRLLGGGTRDQQPVLGDPHRTGEAADVIDTQLCQRFSKIGSGPLSVNDLGLGLRRQEYAFAEQIEVGAAVHLPLDHF